MSASSRSETVRKTFAANGDSVTLPLNGLPAVGLTITGNWTGTLQVEQTFDGDTWSNAKVLTELDATVSLPLTANQIGLIKGQGRAAVRVRASAAMTGSAVVVLNATEGLVTAGTGGGPVSVADGADTALGTTTDAGITTDVNGTVIGFLRGGIKQWAAFLARFPAALGGTTAAASLPVTLSTDGPFAVQTGGVTETAPATDTASSGLNGRLQRVAQRLTSLIALLPAALTGSGNLKAAIVESTATVTTTGAGGTFPVTNANLDAALSTLLTTSDFDTKAGALTETAPATDTASSGHNGRLQRIAQNLTTLIATILKVQGAGAAGAGPTGNPVLIGGSDGTNAQTAKTALGVLTTQGQAGILTVVPTVYAGSNDFRALISAAQIGDGNTGPNTPMAALSLFNGTNWDRQRNNIDVTLLASAARTTLQNSANILTYNCKGIIVTVDITATVSTVSITPSINYIDPASGKAIPLLTGTTLAAAGTTTYWVDEAALASVPAPFTKSAQAALGRIITVNIAVGNANSQTYSVGLTLIP